MGRLAFGSPAVSLVRALAVLLVVLAGGRSTAFGAPGSKDTSTAVTTSAETRATAVAGLATSSGVAPRVLSQYEQDSLKTGLTRLGAEVEPNPEGKRVESVEVVVLDVFEPRDPAPGFLNWFHANTHDDVVRREVLLRPGQPYTALLAAESERNLRKFIQYSVVLVTPIKGTTPNSVRILVVTKDVWSLRLSWDPAFNDGRLTSLLLSPAELNLMGSTQAVSAIVDARPNNVWLGLNYYVPRVAGSRITSTLSARAQVNCKTGDLEGGTGTFSYGKPLFSTRTAWAWGVSTTYTNQIARVGLGAVNAICSSPGAAGARVALDPNLPAAPTQTRVAYLPFVYRNEALTSQIGFTRSFFVKDKINLSFGVEALRERNASLGPPTEVYTGSALFDQQQGNRTCWPPNQASQRCAVALPVSATLDHDIDPARVQSLYEQQRLPASVFRVGPYVYLSAYKTNFVRLLNVNTLGLQEDVQLGHNVSLKIYPALRPLASRNILGTIASVDYTLPMSGGFVRVGASSTIEASGGEDDFAKVGGRRSSSADAKIEIRTYLATPSLGLGRFVMGTTLLDNPQWRYVAPILEVGSADRLRGYSPGTFSGRTVFVNNLEFRTRPLELFSTLLGLVAFWDVGMADDGLGALMSAPDQIVLPPGARRTFEHEVAELTLANGVGAGLRVLLPQIDRQVFRIDLGFPAVKGGLEHFTFTAGFHQAFGDN